MKKPSQVNNGGEILSTRLAMWSYAAYALTRYAQLRSDHAVIKCVLIAL